MGNSYDRKSNYFLDEFNYEEIPKIAKENAIRSFLDIIGVAASAS
tara:strand:+ start:294 stop:428 length:135 start_codon:yes stop_codon:yes gene_type:complete